MGNSVPMMSVSIEGMSKLKKIMRMAVVLAVTAPMLLTSTAASAEVQSSTKVYFDLVDGLTVGSAPGKANRITIENDGNNVIIRDTGDSVTVGMGACTAIDTHSVRCPAPVTGGVDIYGGDGDDILTSNVSLPSQFAVYVLLAGGPGNDLLAVGRTGGPTYLRGDEGNDTHRGGSGDDVMEGGPGGDGFYGNGGFDTVAYGYSHVPVTADIDGEIGDDGATGERDTIKTDVEALRGGFGDDTLIGSDGPDTLMGASGTDTLIGLGGDDSLHGTEVHRFFWAEGDVLEGGNGNDELSGSDGADTLRGGPGADTLNAFEGDDHLEGGADFDNLLGSEGKDHLDGGLGFDLLDAGAGDDILYGGPGGDGDQLDSLSGGPGIDTANYAGRAGAVRLSIDGLANDGEELEYDSIKSDVETLWGGRGDDILTATNKGTANTVLGGGGNDTITTLDADGLDDVDGGPGADSCTTDNVVFFQRDGRHSCE